MMRCTERVLRSPLLIPQLIQAVQQTGNLKMPPDEKLGDEQIALLGRWVAAGFRV